LYGLKIPSCWDRGKLCADPLCPTLSFNIKFDFWTKKPPLLDAKIKYEDSFWSKYVPIV
jgi:hypothetical protein